MEKIFVPAKYKVTFFLNNIDIGKMPRNLGLATTIQFTDSLTKIKNFLEKYGKRVFIGKTNTNKTSKLEAGQITGCNLQTAKAIESKVDAFLYVGSGKFHPMMLALITSKPIFIFNPVTQEFYEFKEKPKIKNKQAIQTKILSAENIGILISLKPGQNKLKKALKLKEKLEKQNKQVYLFIFDNFQLEQLENWPKMLWINTACPGFFLEQDFIDINDIEI